MSSLAVLPPRDDGFVRKKWSVKECRFLTDNGLLEPGKFELIEGEIIFKMGQGRLHIAAVTHICTAIGILFGPNAVQSQAQIGIGEIDEFNDPEPDVAVLRGTVADYLDHEPNPATDILLVVEAAHTSLPGDTTTKARLYSRYGIPEFWVVDIKRRELIVYLHPTEQGYSDIRTYSEGESIAPRSVPGSPVMVNDLMP